MNIAHRAVLSQIIELNQNLMGLLITQKSGNIDERRNGKSAMHNVHTAKISIIEGKNNMTFGDI